MPHVVEHHDSGNGLSLILGLIILIAVMVFAYYFGLPALRQAAPSGTQINIPEKIDVNIQQSGSNGY